MSFQIVLDTSNVFETNTSLKDFTWAYDTSSIPEGNYLMSYSFSSANIALTNFTSNGPTVLSVDFGVRASSYAGGTTTQARTTTVMGPVRLNWRSATVATLLANRMDNFPILVKDLNKASNFIRLRLETNNGALVGTGVASWIVFLYFEKI